MISKLSKKRLIVLAASIIIVAFLLLTGVGSYYYVQSSEAPQPTFAFASDRAGNGDIFVVEPDGQIYNLTDDPNPDWDPTWSPDGKMLAFTSHRSGDSDIWLLDTARIDVEGQVQNLTNYPAWDYSPTWSPSGQSVAFVSERDGDPEIFVQNLAETTAIQLTFNEEMDRLPAWSPDNKYIAFAAVRRGAEEIHLVRPDGTDEQLITPQPLQGTSPAWSPDSRHLAFIGWNEAHKSGIYIIGPELENVDLLYQSDTWLGSLGWSADGKWLTFTSWESGNHELYALSATNKAAPVRLTFNEAWDDFLAINPKATFAAAIPADLAQPVPTRQGSPQTDFATGVNMADLSLAYLVNDMGLVWAKSYVNWATVESEPGQFNWVDADNIVDAFSDQEINILMRVHGTPDWAKPTDSPYTHPPDDMVDFAKFMTALARRYKGQVAAYEIWNEPNLAYEWGYLEPDPAAYTKMLKAAYEAIKAVDPDALVISGGLATTGNGSDDAYGDLAFLQGMYEAGAKGYFDALGSHPYAYGRPPDIIDPDGLSLSRVVDQHEVMQANHDGQTPIWITETGWVLETSWNLGEHNHFEVTQQQQAEYVSRAYTKIHEDWPFVKAFFLFNLDFSTVSWYPADQPMRWYAILNPDRSPRPAYTELRRVIREE